MPIVIPASTCAAARRDTLGLTPREFARLARLTTPQRIQAFVNAIPINHEEDGETTLSVREVLRQRRAHCIEGAFVAACALWIGGAPPLVMHMDCDPCDYPHVVTLFRCAVGVGRDLQVQRRRPAFSRPRLSEPARAGTLLFPRILRPARPPHTAQLFNGVRPAAHRSAPLGDARRHMQRRRRPAGGAAALSARVAAAGGAAVAP